MFANCTHIMVSLLKAWKVTVVGIEGPHQKLFFQGNFFHNSASKMKNCIIVDIVNILCYYWQTLYFLSLKWSYDEI